MRDYHTFKKKKNAEGTDEDRKLMVKLSNENDSYILEYTDSLRVCLLEPLQFEREKWSGKSIELHRNEETEFLISRLNSIISAISISIIYS